MIELILVYAVGFVVGASFYFEAMRDEKPAHVAIVVGLLWPVMVVGAMIGLILHLDEISR